MRRSTLRTGTILHAHAAAKINLALVVGARQSDGYHPIQSVMQSVGLWDDVEATVSDDGLSLVVEEFQPGAAAGVATSTLAGADNLVLVAARALALASPGVGAALRLRKRIPVAAGMGGGSADAAAALTLLDRLWGANLGEETLLGLAADIGSDVPFCLRGGTQLAQGRGERLDAIPSALTLWWVLGMDALGLSTAAVYGRYDELAPRVGEHLGAQRGPLDPRIVLLLEALREGSPRRVGAALVNDLEPAAFNLRPALADRKQELLAAGAVGALLAGSGPTMLGLCEDEAHARALAQRVQGVFTAVAVVSGPVAGVRLAPGR